MEPAHSSNCSIVFETEGLKDVQIEIARKSRLNFSMCANKIYEKECQLFEQKFQELKQAIHEPKLLNEKNELKNSWSYKVPQHIYRYGKSEGVIVLWINMLHPFWIKKYSMYTLGAVVFSFQAMIGIQLLGAHKFATTKFFSDWDLLSPLKFTALRIGEIDKHIKSLKAQKTELKTEMIQFEKYAFITLKFNEFEQHLSEYKMSPEKKKLQTLKEKAKEIFEKMLEVSSATRTIRWRDVIGKEDVATYLGIHLLQEINSETVLENIESLEEISDVQTTNIDFPNINPKSQDLIRLFGIKKNSPCISVSKIFYTYINEEIEPRLKSLKEKYQIKSV